MKKLSMLFLCLYFLCGIAYAQTVYDDKPPVYGSSPARPVPLTLPDVKAKADVNVKQSVLDNDPSAEPIVNSDPKHADVPQPLDRDTDRKGMND